MLLYVIPFPFGKEEGKEPLISHLSKKKVSHLAHYQAILKISLAYLKAFWGFTVLCVFEAVLFTLRLSPGYFRLSLVPKCACDRWPWEEGEASKPPDSLKHPWKIKGSNCL